MTRVTGVKHDNKGEIVEYQLENGQIIKKDEGIRMAQDGKLEGVIVGVSKKGEKYLRSTPDGNESNNLDSMPEIK